MDGPITRRHFASGVASIVVGGLLGRSSDGAEAGQRTAAAGSTASRLTARPRGATPLTLTAGPLGLGDGDRDGVVFLPSTAPNLPLPLLVLLHGATQSGSRMLTRLSVAVAEAGVAVVAPDSRGVTWDAIRGEFGADVAYLNRVLEHVFARLPVNPRTLTIGGFSDGASYALSLGLANGDLFPNVLAFSPGFVMPAPATGKPRVFISHGTEDQILPIDVCSRVIVPQLRGRGYDVTFREFAGRHEVPAAIASEGLRWMTKP